MEDCPRQDVFEAVWERQPAFNCVHLLHLLRVLETLHCCTEAEFQSSIHQMMAHLGLHVCLNQACLTYQHLCPF